MHDSRAGSRWGCDLGCTDNMRLEDLDRLWLADVDNAVEKDGVEQAAEDGLDLVWGDRLCARQQARVSTDQDTMVRLSPHKYDVVH